MEKKNKNKSSDKTREDDTLRLITSGESKEADKADMIQGKAGKVLCRQRVTYVHSNEYWARIQVIGKAISSIYEACWLRGQKCFLKILNNLKQAC